MALMPVYYNSWNSSKKRKMKFKSAEEKAAYLAAQESEYGIAKKRRNNTATTIEPLVPKTYVRETVRYPSRGDGVGVALKAPDKVYTGTKMIGIGTLHKSNAVPVFCDDEAKAMANMRR
jgi:hypothetical protein